VDSVTIRRQDKVVATVLGAGFDPQRSSWKDFQAGAGVGLPIGLTSLAAERVPLEMARLAVPGIRYWALGGQVKREISTQSGVVVAFPGAPQGRSSQAAGAHGAVLVSLEVDGQLRTQTVDCDGVRWLTLSLAVAESIHVDALKDLLAERALQVTSKFPDLHLLVDWQVATTGDYSAEFRREENVGRLLKWLRHEFGGSPGLWSVSLKCSAPQNLPKGWQEEDTLLGDYLREVARYRQDAKLPFHLTHYAGGQDEVAGVTRLTRMDAATRESVLDAALLGGIERLGGNQS
jgi:hypothetical protein